MVVGFHEHVSEPKTTYADGRRVFDADSHIMEPYGWLESYAPNSLKGDFPPMDMGEPMMRTIIEDGLRKQEQRATDPAEAAAFEQDFMSVPRRGYAALGATDSEERSKLLDLLGFEVQIVFPTSAVLQLRQCRDDQFLPAVEAMNRGLAAFCADEPRLISVAYIPMQSGPDVALDMLDKALAEGSDVVMVDAVPPEGGMSPTHPDFDAVWEAFTDHDLPVMLHIGLENKWVPVRSSFFDNGRALPRIHSDAPANALSFLAIGFAPQLFIGSLIFDGVLDRHPDLRFAVSELGGTWVPGFLHFIDSTHRSFRPLQDLSHLQMKPSEYVRKHFCFSPFATENVGFMIENAGAELFMFSSDYPHLEGTDDPIRRYERSMEGISDDDRAAFYHGNLTRILGSRLPAAAVS